MCIVVDFATKLRKIDWAVLPGLNLGLDGWGTGLPVVVLFFSCWLSCWVGLLFSEYCRPIVKLMANLYGRTSRPTPVSLSWMPSPESITSNICDNLDNSSITESTHLVLNVWNLVTVSIGVRCGSDVIGARSATKMSIFEKIFEFVLQS